MKYLKSIYNRIRFNRRNELRLEPVETFSCSILRQKSGLRYIVRVCDLSANGMGLLSKEDAFDLEDSVVVHLKIAGGEYLSIGGRIINQLGCQPGPGHPPDQILYRFSIQFDQPIDYPLPGAFAGTCDPWT